MIFICLFGVSVFSPPSPLVFGKKIRHFRDSGSDRVFFFRSLRRRQIHSSPFYPFPASAAASFVRSQSSSNSSGASMFRFVRAVERGTARRSSPPRSGSALLFSPPPTFFACRAMTSRHTRERKQCFFLLLFSSAMRPLPRPESFTEGLVWPCIDAPRGGQGKRTRDLLDAGASLLPFFWTLWHHQPLKLVVSQTRTLLSPLDLRPPRIRSLTLHNSPFPHEPTEWLSPCPPRWLSGPRSPRVAPGKSRFGWHADRRKGQTSQGGS